MSYTPGLTSQEHAEVQVSTQAHVMAAEPSRESKLLPTINLPEGPVQLRRLGLDDPFFIVDIFSAAVDAYATEQSYRVKPLALDTEEGKLRFALLGFQGARETLMPWLASLLGKTTEDIRNPAVFPVTALPDLIAALMAHPDIESLGKGLFKLWVSEKLLPLRQAFKGGNV